MSQFGFWVVLTVLQWRVAELTAGSPLEAARLYAIQLAPWLIVPFLSGHLVDQLGARRLLIQPIAAIGVLSLVGGILSLSTHELTVTGVQMLGGALGVASALAAPAFQSMLAMTLPKNALARGVALFGAGQSIARMAGPALGAVTLLVSTNAGWVLVGYSTVCLLAIWVAPHAENGARGLPCARVSDPSWFAGLRIVWFERDLRRAVTTVAIASACCMSYSAVLPAVAVQRLDAGQAGYALLLMSGGAGAVIGALSASRGVWRSEQSSGLLLLMALGLTGVTSGTTLPVAVSSCAMVSAAGTALMVRTNVYIQARIDDPVRGRVMALYLWAWIGVLPLGGYALGVVTQQWSIPRGGLLFALLVVVRAAILRVDGGPTSRGGT